MSFSKEDLELIYNSRPHSYRIAGEPYSESRQAAYVAEMVRQQKEREKGREKFPVSTIQCVSTQAILDRDPETDKEWFNRPLPDNWKREDVGEREVDFELYGLIETTRRRPKNSIEFDDRTATPAASRAAAIESFTQSPGISEATLTMTQRAVIRSLCVFEKSNAPIESEFASMMGRAGIASEQELAMVEWKRNTGGKK